MHRGQDRRAQWDKGREWVQGMVQKRNEQNEAIDHMWEMRTRAEQTMRLVFQD